MTQDELTDILDDIGLSPKIDHSRNNLIIECPQCGERECSISINKQYHPFGCFRKKRCGFTGTLYDILKIHNKLHLLFKESFVDRSKTLSKLEYINTLENKDNESEVIETLPTIKLPIGYRRLSECDHLESRGLIDFNKYEVGKTKIDPKFRNYYVFPIREDNEIKGLVGRHCWPSDKIESYNKQYYEEFGLKNKVKRYNNSNSEFSKLVYGLDDLNEKTHTIILVEGIFDRINTNTVFIEDDEFIRCCATFKCDASSDQIRKIKKKAPNLKTCILLYDPDVVDKIIKNAFKLEKEFSNLLIGFCVNDKDPGDMNLTDFEEVMSNLQSPFQFSKSHVSLSKIF